MCKLIWEDGLAEWLLPGSLALWEPDKDFMILEKVPEYRPFESRAYWQELIDEPRHIVESDFLPHRNESWDALERLINDRGGES
jgi:hypothetical protein